MTVEKCPICKGKGTFRSGQWGGFHDTCIRCQGSGYIDSKKQEIDDARGTRVAGVLAVSVLFGCLVASQSVELGGTIIGVGVIVAVLAGLAK